MWKLLITAAFAITAELSRAYVDDGTKVVIGTRETMTAEIPSATTWDKPVVVCGVLRKIGAGKLTIVGEKLYGAGRIDVAEGELEITATGAGSAEFAEPTSVMSGAAMWLDASMHVADSTGAASSGDAVAWYDVRDTDWADPGFAPSHIYAQAYNGLAIGGLWPQVGIDGASRAYVDFGGTSSGQYMAWLTPSGTKAWIPVVHSFVAYTPNGGHGHVLGTATSPGDDPNKLVFFATSGGASGTTLFQCSPDNALRHLRLGRIFRDGVQADVAASIDTSATQLVETEAYRPDAKAEAFFNFRNYQQSAGSGSAGNRVGGGRLHEVLIFTNAISETDRVLVEQRLLRKWVKRSGYSIPPEITVASGATLTLAPAAASATKVKAEGTFRRPGATVSTVDGLDPFCGVAGTVEFDAGATVSNRATVSVAPQSGKTYAVDAWNTMTVSDGTAGETEKTGSGSTAFAGFGDAAKFTVSQGFASVRTNATDVLREVAANCIEDGGFEGIWSGTTWNAYNNGTAIGAWTVTNYYTSASTRIAYTTGWTPMWQSGKVLGAPEGDYYLLLKQGGGVRQTFSIEKAGRYSIMLRCYPRSDSSSNAAFARVYVDGRPVGTVQCRFGENDWDLARLVTTCLSTGEHVLALMSEVTTDNAIGIDDVRVVMLDEGRDLPTVANGNFEDVDWLAGGTAQSDVSSAINNNATMPPAYLKGWTTSGTAYLVRRLPYLRSHDNFVGPDNDNGAHSILMTNNGEIRQGVSVPATGLYRLSAKVARFQHSKVESLVGSADRLECGYVTLSIGSACETFSVSGWTLTEFEMPNAVLLSAGETVEIAVTATDDSGKINNIMVDDVRLVRETGNLVRNGGFEDGNDSATVPPIGWTLLANPKNKTLRYSLTSPYIGAEPVEGTARLCVASGTHIAQTIPLSAGYYWLSFWDVSRSQNGRITGGEYWPADITVTLSNGSTTNFCDTVKPSTNCSSFIRREYLVKVETAGDYTLGFEGENTAADIRSYIDAVSLRPALDVVADAVPDTIEGLEVSVGDAALLQLDYDGLARIGSLRGDCSLKPGEQSSATQSFLRGLGRLFSKAKLGLMMLIR